MKKLILTSIAALSFTLPALAQEEPEAAASPTDIVNSAPQSDWNVIAPEDMLVMTLAPDAEGNERQVVIQLMPAPFSQGWVENIRTLSRANWYDGISVNRVQDNYVVQWGDPGYDNPESGEVEQKPLPDGLNVMSETEYVATDLLRTANSADGSGFDFALASTMVRNAIIAANGEIELPPRLEESLRTQSPILVPRGSDLDLPEMGDAYAPLATHALGWPIAGIVNGAQGEPQKFWPTHCYGMVGVGRNYSPDTGSGAELYTVIGQAPRHLDRNIALVGRIISGMEHLSSLPRGSGTLGFYTNEEAGKRVPILSVRVASDLPQEERPLFEYLNTETQTFARYAEARANRLDPFFIVPAGGADICNIPVPVRAFEYTDDTAE